MFEILVRLYNSFRRKVLHYPRQIKKINNAIQIVINDKQLRQGKFYLFN